MTTIPRRPRTGQIKNTGAEQAMAKVVRLKTPISPQRRLTEFFGQLPGFYQLRSLQTGGEWDRRAKSLSLEDAVAEQLRGHFVLNCHQRSRPGFTRSATIDIDLKPGTKKLPEKVDRQVEGIVKQARTMGWSPWVISSTSGRGRHIHFRWDTDQRIWCVRAAMRDMVVKAGFDVIPKDVELFPGWDHSGDHGTLIAAPFAGSSKDLFPTEHWDASPPVDASWGVDEPKPRQTVEAARGDVLTNAQIAVEALKLIPPPEWDADDAFTQRIRMFLALHWSTAGDQNTLADFQEWVGRGSQGWDKWEEWERISARKWRKRPRAGTLSLKYVIGLARKVDPSFQRETGGRIGSEAWLVDQAAESLRPQLMYVREDLEWAILDGYRWRRHAGTEALREIHRSNLDQIPALWGEIGKCEKKDPEIGRFSKAISQAETKRTAADVATLLRADLICGKEIFDQATDRLCFTNGYYDMNLCIMEDNPRPDLYFSRQVPRDLHLSAKMDGWEKHLATLLPDKTARQAFRMLMGYVVLGRNTAKIFPVLIGPRDGGKSTTMEIIKDVLGPDYVQTARDRLFQVQRQQSDATAGHDANLTSLMGPRLILIPEPPPTQQWNTTSINRWTGGDGMGLRGFYKGRTETVVPPGVLLTMCNDMPSADAFSEAFWSRVRLIKFDKPQKPDVHYRERFMKQHADGVLRWLVEAGCEFLNELAAGRDPLASLTAASNELIKTERWKDEPLAMVLLTQTQRKEGSTISFSEWRRRATALDAAKMEVSGSSSHISSILKRLGYETKKKNTRKGDTVHSEVIVCDVEWLPEE